MLQAAAGQVQLHVQQAGHSLQSDQQQSASGAVWHGAAQAESAVHVAVEQPNLQQDSGSFSLPESLVEEAITELQQAASRWT